MKNFLQKTITPRNTLIILWPVVIWFAVAYFSMEEDVLHHPFEFIFLLFILNCFGLAFYEQAIKPTREKEIENAYKTVLETEKNKKIIKEYEEMFRQSEARDEKNK